MYTFNNIEVVHIPDQTRHFDKAMVITLSHYYFAISRLGSDCLTLRLHLVCESFQAKTKACIDLS